MAKEQRVQLRLPVASRVFIELIAPGLSPQDTGEIAECKTLDVSHSGLCVSLNRQLQVGVILQVGVDLFDTPDTLYLAGEVRWCREIPDEPGQWSAGFQLLNAGNSDIDNWNKLLSEIDS